MNCRHVRLLCLALWLAWLAPAGAEELRLEDAPGGLGTAANLTYWRDANGHGDIEAARAADRAGQFQAVNGRIAYGLDRAPHWFRLDLHRPAAMPATWWIEVAHPALDNIQLYIPAADGYIRQYEVGDHQAFASRPILHRYFILPVTLPPERTTTVYLRVQSDDTLIMPVRVWSPQRFVEADTLRNLAMGAYYGLILAMLVYNAFLFVKLRDALYLYYLAFSAAVLLVVSELSGQNFQYLFPNNLWWVERQHVIFPMFALCLTLLFARRFLELKSSLPGMDRAVWGVMGFTVAAAVTGVAVDYPLGHKLMLLAAPLTMLTGLLAGILRLRQGYRPAKYFVAAEIPYQIGAIIAGLTGLGLKASDVLMQQAVGMGSALEVLLFSLALSDRIGLLRQQKEEAQAQLKASDEHWRLALEQRVEQRTRELELAKASAEEASLVKTRFLAAAGHDLRQPLAATNLFLGALKLSALTPRQGDIIARMEQAMATFNGLLDSLLDISKLDAGVTKPELQAVPVPEMFNWLQQSFAPMASEKRLGFKLYFPLKQTLVVHSDIDLLKSVLMNLVSNAIKYTPRGAILVSARPRGNWVLFQVWDTGAGIADENLKRIFDEFYQVDNPQRDRTKGLGLGLSIVKRALSLLGGEITCRSRIGRGSVFEFRLPLADVPDAPDPRGTLVPQEGIDGVFARGRRFIVVEDDALVARAMASFLENMGGAVKSFPNAEDALRDADTEHADYFISDYMLGGALNGIQFLNLLRQRLARPINAVLITGDTSPAFYAELTDCPWTVLHKPLSPSKLVSSLRENRLRT